MRGGRSYSSRGSGNRGSGSSFRGSNSSYRGSNSSSGRYNSSSNSSFNNRNSGSNSYHGNSGGSSGGRSRFEHRSSSDRFSRKSDDRSYNRNDSRNRDDSPSRKRARHDAGSSRRGFSNSSSDYNHRYENHGRSSRDSSSHRRTSGRQSSPVRNSRGSGDRSKERMGPPSRPPMKKFRPAAKGSGGGVDRSARDSPPPARGSVKKTKIAPAANRSTVVRRRLVLRQRDSARRVKLARLRSTMKKRETVKAAAATASNSDDETNENAEKNENGDENASPEKSKATDSQAENAENIDTNGTADKPAEDGHDDDKEAAANDVDKKKAKINGKKAASDKKGSPRKFIRLTCVHCRTKAVTFEEYTNHLYWRKHKVEMRKVALRQKTLIARMRATQRKAQRELEENIADNEEKPLQFCMLCRLNYRTSKDEHQASMSHVTMQKFLLPYCKVCHISFKSPMVYETHRCSLDHIKRKARNESTGNEVDDPAAEDDDAGLPVDLDKFLTVDSVGDVDDIHLHNDDSDENNEPDASTSASKAEINVGNEHVKKIEVYYCDLCRFYLPHLEDPEAALQKHCSTRNHLRAYLRFKENQSLKQAAELIHRRDRGEKTPKKDGKPSADGKSDTTDASSAADKAWADGDKDLSEENPIESIAQEDEDEDSTIASERYDRFKNSDKSDAEMEKDGDDDAIAVDKSDTKAVILEEENAVIASEA